MYFLSLYQNVLPVGQDEEAAGGGSDHVVAPKQRQLLADDTACGGVHQEACVVLEDLVEHDPLPWAEAEVQGILWVGGGGAPVAADGAEVHVVVDVIGRQEAVGDAVDEVGRERRPACCRCGHGRQDERGFGEVLKLEPVVIAGVK